MTGKIKDSHKPDKSYRGQITRPKGHLPLMVYQANWSWDHKQHYWLLKQIAGKTVLNFPCGMSRIGYRADSDPNVKPDIIADLSNPLEYFKPLSYDTVICDPPFDVAYFQKLGWCHELAKIAKLKLIFSTPPMALHLKKRDWLKSYHLTDTQGPLLVRIRQKFERNNHFFKDP